MSLFSSRREIRLWRWVAAVVLAIFLTIGVARQLADYFQGSAVIGVGLFLTCCFLVLAMVITQGLKTRPGGLEIAVGLGIFAVYLLVFVRMSIPTERSHLIEYGVLALLILEALQERIKQGRKVPVPAIIAIVASSSIGVLDEIVQAWIPGRVSDPEDMLFNTLASAMAVGSSVALSWARNKYLQRIQSQ